MDLSALNPAATTVGRRQRRRILSAPLVSAACHGVALLGLCWIVVPDGSQFSGVLTVSMDAGAEAPALDFTVADEEVEIGPEPTLSQVRIDGATELVTSVPIWRAGDPRPTPHGGQESPVISAADLGKRIGGRADAMFFGASASGNDFIFILDCSGSMTARRGERFARARDELIRSVSQLRPDQRFYVYLFNWSTFPMFGDPQSRGNWFEASGENLSRLRAWLYSVRPISGTDPRAALQESLEMNPDAIFLLSDGRFNTPRWDRSPATVFDVVSRRNAPRVQVNAIAFEDATAARGMSRLAELTDAQFRFVPSPGDDPAAPDDALGPIEDLDAKNWPSDIRPPVEAIRQ